jgi:hypothetical protein
LLSDFNSTFKGACPTGSATLPPGPGQKIPEAKSPGRASLGVVVEALCLLLNALFVKGVDAAVQIKAEIRQSFIIRIVNSG